MQQIYGLNNDITTPKNDASEHLSSSFQFQNKTLNQIYLDKNQESSTMKFPRSNIRFRNRTVNQRPSTQHETMNQSLQGTYRFKNMADTTPRNRETTNNSTARHKEDDNFPIQSHFNGQTLRQKIFLQSRIQPRNAFSSQHSPRQRLTGDQTYHNNSMFSNASIHVQQQINKQEKIINHDKNVFSQSKTAQQSPRLQLIEIGQININQDIRYYLEMMEQIKIENEQLKDLNRKLVDELEIYRFKDSLKEAEYIIEHQYNNMLIPQRYKYIFDQKQKYLQAINFNFKNEQELIQMKVDAQINELRTSFALEHEELQEMLSGLICQLGETTKIKEEIEAELDFVVQDSVEQIKVHIQKYNEERYLKISQEQELVQVKLLCQELEAKLTFMLDEQGKLNKDLSTMKGFNKDMNKRIKKYQKMYNDVDINSIHEKITLLTTENDYYKNLSQKLQNQNVNLKMKAKTLLMHKKSSLLTSGDVRNSGEQEFTLEELRAKNDIVILEEAVEEDLDKTDKHMQVIRPDFETQLEKSNFSMMARF
eukprot:403343268